MDSAAAAGGYGQVVDGLALTGRRPTTTCPQPPWTALGPLDAALDLPTAAWTTLWVDHTDNRLGGGGYVHKTGLTFAPHSGAPSRFARISRGDNYPDTWGY